MPKVHVHMGLVSSRDPSLLSPGELSVTDDAMYLPNNPALHKAQGRSKFNTASEGAIPGGRYLEFDGAADKIVIMAGNNYRISNANLTGSFSDLQTGLTSAATLDSVHYNNSHFLLNGEDRNYEVTSSATANLHGMLANTSAPTVSRDAGAGTGFIITSGNTIDYWVEERVKSGLTILRRNSTTLTVTLTGDGSTDKPVITRPDAVNSDATHWALMGTATNGSFPTGAEISEVVIATTTIEDTRTGTDPSIPTGDAYEVVSISLAGVTQNVSRNGPPPNATTGDVFQDSLVTNDTSDKSRIHYSFPDKPHAFPAVNFIRFETKEADEVTAIRVMGKFIMVLMRDTVWRVQTLPRPQDASFQIERVKVKVHGAHGCVGPKALAEFSFGQGPRLAYVSRYGVLVTDGYSWDDLADDMDWENTVEVNKLSSSVLINNPRRYRLEFYFTPKGGSINTRCMLLHYHPSHAKQATAGSGFRSKLSGPNRVHALDSFVANIGSLHHVFTCNADGFVYLEGQGYTDASSAGGPKFKIRTGDLAFDDESRARRWYVHHQDAGDQTATATIIQREAGEDDHETPAEMPLKRRQRTEVGTDGSGEYLQLQLENSDSTGAVAIDYFEVTPESLGESEAAGGA